MRTCIKLIMTGLTAIALLASLTASGAARNFEFSNTSFRVAFTPISFGEPFGFFTVRCNVTMEGSFHARTIPKVSRSLIGYVTRGTVAHPCTGGEAWAWNGTEGALTGASTLPWHLSYEGFIGTLPNITGIRILLRNFKFTMSTFACLGTYAPTNTNGTINVAADRTMTLTPGTESHSIIEGSCPAGRFSGTSSRITLEGTSNPISIRLI
jgi:hypothetical protein